MHLMSVFKVESGQIVTIKKPIQRHVNQEREKERERSKKSRHMYVVRTHTRARTPFKPFNKLCGVITLHQRHTVKKTIVDP